MQFLTDVVLTARCYAAESVKLNINSHCRLLIEHERYFKKEKYILKNFTNEIYEKKSENAATCSFSVSLNVLEYFRTIK